MVHAINSDADEDGGFVRLADDLAEQGIRPDSLVLWNPVLDVPGTFVAPSLPWGMRNFTANARAEARDRGWLDIDGEFRVGSVFLNELERIPDLTGAPGELALPTLIIHGDRDTYVSYAASERAAERPAAVQLHTIHGSEHGFPEPEQERDARLRTTAHFRSTLGLSG